LLHILLTYLLLAGLGDSPCDLMTLIDADDYFRSRNVTPTAATMTELAGKKPTDAKAEVRQLLAIRWLGDHQVAAAQALLQQLANGKRAQDPGGFARDYAGRALARLAGKPLAPARAPEGSVHEGLAWFPVDVTFFGALDLRAPWPTKPFTLPDRAGKPLRVQEFLPGARDRDGLYDFVDQVGNLRLDRIAFGYRAPAEPTKPGRLLVRLTGQGNHGRLAERLRGEAVPGSVQQRKGPRGEPITLLTLANLSTLALVGDTDLLVAADPEQNARSRVEAIEQALEVRAGVRPGLLQGPFAEDLRGIPGRASGALIGRPTDSIWEALIQGLGPFHNRPERLAFYALVDRSVTVHYRFTLANAAQAGTFREDAEASRNKYLAALREVELSDARAAVLIQALEGIELKTEGSSVTGSVCASEDVPPALAEVWLPTLLAMSGTRKQLQVQLRRLWAGLLRDARRGDLGNWVGSDSLRAWRFVDPVPRLAARAAREQATTVRLRILSASYPFPFRSSSTSGSA
jgi:hypothetical protein